MYVSYFLLTQGFSFLPLPPSFSPLFLLFFLSSSSWLLPIYVPVSPASPLPSPAPPTHSPFIPATVSIIYWRSRKRSELLLLHVPPARVKACSGCPSPVSHPWGGRDSGHHPQEGASGDRISWFHQESEFLACEATRQTSLALIFVPLLCYQFFISNENNTIVYPYPLYNNSFSKTIAVLLLVISFGRQLKAFCFNLCFFSVPFVLRL